MQCCGMGLGNAFGKQWWLIVSIWNKILADITTASSSQTMGAKFKHLIFACDRIRTCTFEYELTNRVWWLQVGPEFIHGTKNSSIKEIADAMGCQMRELPYHILFLVLSLYSFHYLFQFPIKQISTEIWCCWFHQRSLVYCNEGNL